MKNFDSNIKKSKLKSYACKIKTYVFLVKVLQVSRKKYNIVLYINTLHYWPSGEWQ